MKNNLTTYRPSFLRKWVLFVMVSLAFWMSGCTGDKEIDSLTDNLGEYNTKTIQHEGVERTYHVYLPKNFNKSNLTPLVLAIHGGGGTGMNFEEVVSAGTLTTAAESRGVVLVMPDGIDKRWNSGRPEIFDGERSYDDVGFISSIIDTMIQNYGIDASRVYSTGISNGGFMSVRLALDLSEKLAAVAPVTAQMSKAVETKVPSVPISIMIVNGTEDPLVPYYGGEIRLFKLGPSRGEVLSTQETIDKFRGFDQCNSPAEMQLLPDMIQEDGTEVEIVKYPECEAGTEVVSVKIIGGGHTWPGGAQYLSPNLVGLVSKEVNASEIILDFFLSHSRN